MPGIAWDIFAEPLLGALSALSGCASVLRAGLAGDHLRAITPSKSDARMIRRTLSEAGVKLDLLKPVEPTLEDVFLAIASDGL